MSSQLRWIFALFQVVLHSFVTTVTVPDHTIPLSYQKRFVRTMIISRFSVIYKDLIRFASDLHFSDSNVYFYVIPRFERLKPRASAGAAALPSTLLRSSMTARLPTCSCWLTEISPDVILSHGVGNVAISFDMEQFYSFRVTPITIYIRKPRELPEL